MTKTASLIVALATILVGYTHAAYADITKGRAALEAGNYSLARREFERSIKQGDYEGRYWIARLYDLGYGVKRDPERAFKMMKEAAEKGVVLAERRLGEMYRDGYGVLQDYPSARTWLDAAATDGDIVAQRELGKLYASTTDIPADPIRAYAWLDVAARSGDQAAIDRRAKLAKSMSPDDIKVANDLARRFAATIASRSGASGAPKK
jgi:TPR repeat protein